MIKRDIQSQWQNIADWYWAQYERDTPEIDLTIWDILERNHGVIRDRPMSALGWSRVQFPDEQSYAHFLLRWS